MKASLGLVVTALISCLILYSCMSQEQQEQVLQNSEPQAVDVTVTVGGDSRAERFLGTFDQISRLSLDIDRNYGNKRVLTDFPLVNDGSKWTGTINKLIVGFDYTITGHAYKNDNGTDNNTTDNNSKASLVAYYPFNGNAYDESGNSKNLTKNGSATLANDRFGNSNSAYIFDGTDDYFEFPQDASLNPTRFSFSAWVNASDNSTNWGTVLKSRNSYSGYNLYKSNQNTWQVWIGDGSSWTVIGSENVEINQWVHLVGTYDGSELKLYKNGNLNASDNSSFVVNAWKPLRIGAGKTNQETAGYYFNGVIDEVRIYNKALSAAEIRDLYTSSFNPVESLYDNLSISKIQLNTIGNMVDNFSVA